MLDVGARGFLGSGEGVFTWLGMGLGGVDGLPWKTSVGLEIDHCVPAFVAGGDLEGCGV